jgi:copper(I)-binding protein
MYSLRRSVSAAALLCSTVSFAHAADVATVANAWSRPTVPGQSVAAAYFDITANVPATLIAADTSAADKAELHNMSMDGGVMKMRPVARLDLPAHQTDKLGPGGYHLMLVDIKHPLRVGDRLQITLTVQDSKGTKSTLPVSVDVRSTPPSAGGKS